eukprot:CAMPEP_0119340814 /NCGR_PEP_ID=MMETSP1333-20130426/101060_1 /TAXON_ID=418940 /ORGANISM="Scyphosphaera apsteinii, Strain RCC1455" /LENGTH=187 /DNA_ID=CAMNT_0007352645 /DNA_START=531 /DNA_END=1091 /DNA_ORIENTATION=-
MSLRLHGQDDFVLQAVRSHACFAFTGMGDVPCCTGLASTKAWYGGGGWASRLGQLFYNPLFKRDVSRRSWNHSDHAWVEVTRWPTRCLLMASTFTNGRGMPTLCDGLLQDNETYGIWFFAAGGSGVWVNLGRSLRFEGRRQAKAYLCKHGSPSACPGHATLTDRYWCKAALNLGYDSIQVGQRGVAW